MNIRKKGKNTFPVTRSRRGLCLNIFSGRLKILRLAEEGVVGEEEDLEEVFVVLVPARVCT